MEDSVMIDLSIKHLLSHREMKFGLTLLFWKFTELKMMGLFCANFLNFWFYQMTTVLNPWLQLETMLETKLLILESPIISEKLTMSNAAYPVSKELRELNLIVMRKDHGTLLPETGLNLVDHSTVIILTKMPVEVDGNSLITSKDLFWLKAMSFKLPTIAQTEIQFAGKLQTNKDRWLIHKQMLNQEVDSKRSNTDLRALASGLDLSLSLLPETLMKMMMDSNLLDSLS